MNDDPNITHGQQPPENTGNIAVTEVLTSVAGPTLTPSPRTAPDGAAPTGGNGGGVKIFIDDPRPNAAVVGVNPGIPVSVSGSTDSNVPDKTFWVAVSLGGDPCPNFQADANGDWNYLGATAKGGPITIYAHLYGNSKGTVPLATAGVMVTVNDNPALSASIASPADRATIQTWLGPTIASGTATFDAVIDSRAVSVSITGPDGKTGPAGSATLDAGTPSGTQVKYNWTCPLTFTQDGSTTITTGASGGFTDSQGQRHNVSAQTPATCAVTVRVDGTAPALQVTFPLANFQIDDTKPGDANYDPQGVPVTVTGTAADSQSGVKSVGVGGDISVPVTVTPPSTQLPGTTWSWTAPIKLSHIQGSSDNGKRTIAIQAWDNAGNGTVPPQNVTVYLQAPFQVPLDPNDSLSVLTYLHDLIGFATGANGRIAADSTNLVKVQPEDLAKYFYQPFTLLKADEQVHQVRLCIEVLRNYLADPTDTQLAAEAAYLQSAYQTLLLNIGTSYDELRLARAADNSGRAALAARLGIDLEASRPDKLDKLVLQPKDITEAKLEQLFGLVDTTRNPLSSPSSQSPDLLRWQELHLRAGWTREDYPADANPNFPVPLIDPDLLVENDFAPPALGNSSNTAYELWKARKAWVDGQVQTLANDRLANEADQARLVRLIEAALKPLKMTDLLNFNTLYGKGTKIDDKLGTIPLSFAAFSYLIRLYNLAAGLPLLSDEWDAAYSILVQVQKERQFVTWRAQEAKPTAGSGPITIDPTFFKPNSDAVMLAEWRVTSQERFRWQNTLISRISQSDTLEQGLHAAVGSTEESALPQLRDALLAAIRVPTTIPSLFSTGMAAQDLILSDKATDPHWIITAIPSGAANLSAFATVNKFPVGNPWLANSNTSRWISPQADESAGEAPGSYTYKTAFDLTDFDPSSVRIDVKVAVDDNLVAVKLNGNSQGLTATGFAAFTSLAITSGFVAGVNTLELIVNNAGTTTNPSGLRVEFASTGLVQANPDWLAGRLLIDVKSSGAITTTRVSQAIETIQSILFSVRTRRFGNMGNLASWQIATSFSDFDADWAWMGTYDTWRAAMEVFLYPENVLSPSLPRELMTRQFSSDVLGPEGPASFVQKVRSHMPLTREQARLDAKDYLSALKNEPLQTQLPPQLQNSSFLITDEVDSITFTIGTKKVSGLAGWRSLQSDPQNGVFATFVDPTASPPQLKSGVTLPSLPPYLLEVFYFVPMYLALQLQQSGEYEAALDWFRLAYAYDLRVDQRKSYYGLVLEETFQTKYDRSFVWVRHLDPHDAIAPTRADAYTRFTLLSLARCFLDFADSEFTRDTEESGSLARDLYLSALELLNLPVMQPQTKDFQPNPIPGNLIDRAENSLRKLRNNLNIAGLRRQTCGGIGSGTALLMTAGGQLTLPASPAPQPTPYRYSALIDRAKQLVQLAQQIETPYFAALQQEDAETYNLKKANQDLELANANVDLQALKVTDANDGVALATDQKARAQTQYDTYDGWITTGPLSSETDMITQYQSANDARNWVSGLSAAITAAQASTTAAAGGFFGTGIGGSWGPALTITGLSIGRAAAEIAANNAGTQAQIDSANASFERRQEEWQLQRSLAKNDLAIGTDQIKLANDQVAIATKEQSIAKTQSAHDQAIVNFLNNKFTNVELYEWMSGVLGGVYRYFLQQATAMAQLAQNQLIFERQQAALALIKSDYWQPPAQSTATQSNTTTSQGVPTDRRGLTGSARLLEDITQLDQYAFLTDTRKLQLTKTISLAQLMPFEFQRFRSTGVLPFATPMVLFDQDFPGNYLRLIKRVRVSIVALIPPNQGIKASLATTGVSRTVIGGDAFQTVAIQRGPELVALTSPMNATGLFELDTQPQLLLPFEGTGVDTSWEFRMPQAANLFDYTTIADILVAMDYTALDSSDYRQQVIKQFDRHISLDRAFSFRQEFADLWYILNNPDQSTSAFTVQFSTKQTDFPPNIDQLTIQNVLLYFVHPDDQVVEISASLNVVTQDLPSKRVGGTASSINSTISTRRGNADAWIAMVGRSPIGAWTLILPDTPNTSAGPGTRNLFETGAIQDILFVITYGGLTPPWP